MENNQLQVNQNTEQHRNPYKNQYKIEKRVLIAFVIGLVCLAVYYLPYLILGQDAAYRITDFLDDEVVQYMLGGKYFFAPAGTVVQEILAGTDLSSIQPPCFLLIWFYHFLPFYQAIIGSMLFLAVFAYAGMFLLCHHFLGDKYLPATVIASVCFAVLPFYPTYGLSSLGLPLVAWAFIQIYYNRRKVVAYLTILFFALTSSLVWSGYFVVGFALLAALILLLRREHKTAARVAIGALLLTVAYVWVFRSTIYSLLFSDFVSHRADAARQYYASNFTDSFIGLFKYGQYHAPSHHTYIMAFSLLVIIIGFFCWKRYTAQVRKIYIVLAASWAGALFISIFAAFYGSEAGYAIRAHLGVLESFQLDRIYWLYPMLWYLILALSCAIVSWGLREFVKKRIVANVLGALFLIGMFVFCVDHIVDNSPEYNANLRALLHGEENTYTTYQEFYEPELFEEIQDYIGRDVSEYRVASLGLVPAITTVNGFYTVDSYSTSYSLDYKYAFREVIASELAKSEELRVYYDDWGSRCYLFSSELGKNFTVTRDQQIVLKDYEVNTQALAALGCEYILSAVEIENAQATGLEFLSYFDTPDSEIEIFLYAVTDLY